MATWRPLFCFRASCPSELDLEADRSANYTSNEYHFKCATNLCNGDRSQFAWDINFSLNLRGNLLNRHRETRSEPIAYLVGDNFND
jgi:hypothetical protein